MTQPTDRRREVLSLLRSCATPLSITQIADRLKVHPNTARFHLHALTKTGQVERVAVTPNGPGRPAQLFRARPGMDADGPRNYQLLAEILVGDLAADPQHAPSRAAAAGRAWGARLARTAGGRVASTRSAVGWLRDRLDEWGFAPQVTRAAGGQRIELRHCPFLDLAQTNREVICPAHLGLMQGAMSALGAPVTVARLEPFAEPDRCLAHLAGERNR